MSIKMKLCGWDISLRRFELSKLQQFTRISPILSYDYSLEGLLWLYRLSFFRQGHLVYFNGGKVSDWRGLGAV